MHQDANGFLINSKKVTLKPYQPRKPLAIEWLSDKELIDNAGKNLCVDIELFPNYFLVGIKALWCNKFLRFELYKDTYFDTSKLNWILHNYQTIGFNSLKYDLHLIWLAITYPDLSILKSASDAIIYQNIWVTELKKTFNFYTPIVRHIDLIEVAPLKGSLKLYGARIHVNRLQDLPFDVNSQLDHKKRAIVADYNISDLNATEALFNFMKERLELRKDMSQRYNEDLMSKSDAQIAEVVISKEVGKLNGKYPQKSSIKPGYTFKYTPPAYLRFATPALQQLLENVKAAEFSINEFGVTTKTKNYTIFVGNLEFTFGIGGLHSKEKCIAYKACVNSDEEYILIDRDVTSYYPDLILTLHLYPDQMGPKFLDVFGNFKQERVAAKRAKLFTYDKGLKILINGASGKLNQEHSRLYSPKSYIHMTLTGQLCILMLAEMLVCNGFKVISGNTDGIVIYAKKSEYDKLLYWINFWEKETAFRTEETQYSAYYARDVNSYFAVKLPYQEGKIDVKVKGPYSEVGSQSGTQLDTNPTSLICSDAIKALLSKNIPIEETIRACQNFTRFITVRNVKGGAHKDGYYLGKVIRFYYAKHNNGTINYIETNNKVPDTEGAKPCMDLPSEMPTDINYDWYITKATEILYEIGYLKRIEQEKFF